MKLNSFANRKVISAFGHYTVHTIGSLHGTRFAHTIESQRKRSQISALYLNTMMLDTISCGYPIVGITHVESGPKSVISPVGGAETYIFAVT